MAKDAPSSCSKNTFLTYFFLSSAPLLKFLGKFLEQFRFLKSANPTDEAWAKDRKVFDEVSRELKGLKLRFRRPGNMFELPMGVG